MIHVALKILSTRSQKFSVNMTGLKDGYPLNLKLKCNADCFFNFAFLYFNFTVFQLTKIVILNLSKANYWIYDVT